ncbi:hypothetical protein TNCV_4293771 [Trichonephila clavipes]|uniref:Uncharacterized protein n=1 Tax=Trichonephila clavipes TaxID=2585209 RepID=A0A8X6RSI4_TRICX|nr:hypothetical protein TNCV_4293771 [Trichonephila clavipes]
MRSPPVGPCPKTSMTARLNSWPTLLLPSLGVTKHPPCKEVDATFNLLWLKPLTRWHGGKVRRVGCRIRFPLLISPFPKAFTLLQRQCLQTLSRSNSSRK